MKIPQALPQFEKYPAIFIASGEYEAHFHLAHAGELNEIKTIKMAPREEAREKQGMVKSSSDASHLGAVSHHGRYVEDLKMRFSRAMHETIHDLLASHSAREICIFAPKYVQNRIIKKLSQNEQNKVCLRFFTEQTKANPLKMLEIFWQEARSAVTKKIPPNKEAQKILSRPAHKKVLHEIHEVSQLPPGILLAR